MFRLIHSMQELDFPLLTDVYAESLYCKDTRPVLYDAQQRKAEENFYSYLADFFTQYDGIYAVWIEEGCYCAAVRLEPYEDGLLISGLETAPFLRRKGFAIKLLHSVLDYVSKGKTRKLYSHISRDNTASLRLHKQCGFRKVLDYAVYLDGTISHNSDTYCFEE